MLDPSGFDISLAVIVGGIAGLILGGWWRGWRRQLDERGRILVLLSEHRNKAKVTAHATIADVLHSLRVEIMTGQVPYQRVLVLPREKDVFNVENDQVDPGHGGKECGRG